MATRSGRLVVAIALTLAFGLGSLGAWWLIRSRPTPGAFVDAVATADGGAVLIRRERDDRFFLEVHGPDRMRWRALIPRYAGAVGTPAIAATPRVVTARVARDGHPFVFAFDTVHGAKIASFDLVDDGPGDPAAYTAPGRATVFGGGWSVEVLARPDGGARLLGMQLDAHRLAWKVELAAWPDAVWLDGAQVVARTGEARAAWQLTDGTSVAPASAAPTPAAPGLRFDGRTARWGDASYTVPPAAIAPQPYHAVGDRLWVITPDRVTVLDRALTVVRTIER